MDMQHLIKSSGVTQTQIAAALGVSGATITRWVKDEIPANRVAEVAAITGIRPALLRPDLAALFGDGSSQQAHQPLPERRVAS